MDQRAQDKIVYLQTAGDRNRKSPQFVDTVWAFWIQLSGTEISTQQIRSYKNKSPQQQSK